MNIEDNISLKLTNDKEVVLKKVKENAGKKDKKNVGKGKRVFQTLMNAISIASGAIMLMTPGLNILGAGAGAYFILDGVTDIIDSKRNDKEVELKAVKQDDSALKYEL